MPAEETKQAENAIPSNESKPAPMSQMMSQMMNMCCKGEGGFAGCASMMNDMMKPTKNPSPPGQQESGVQSGEKKK